MAVSQPETDNEMWKGTQTLDNQLRVPPSPAHFVRQSALTECMPSARHVPALRAADARAPSAAQVRIDDQWYDLSRWRRAHPAGSHWIDLYKDQDATEASSQGPCLIFIFAGAACFSRERRS
jgi:cytochrome b involved in lipid metabolism